LLGYWFEEAVFDLAHRAFNRFGDDAALVQQGRTLADYCRNLLDAGDQAGARDALTRARSAFTDATELLSAFPDEVRTITGWLSRLDTLAHMVDSTTADEAPADDYSDDQARN
jgi:hypothetical protein